jgi:hypothetical protein
MSQAFLGDNSDDEEAAAQQAEREREADEKLRKVSGLAARSAGVQ